MPPTYYADKDNHVDSHTLQQQHDTQHIYLLLLFYMMLMLLDTFASSALTLLVGIKKSIRPVEIER